MPAESFSAPTPTGDPRTATYNDEVATVNHQETNKIAEDEAARKEAVIGAEAKRGELARTEPLGLQREAFTANAQGLAQSTTNAERRGTIQADYIAKYGSVARGLAATEGRISRSEQNAQELGNLSRKTIYDKAVANYLASLVKEKPEVAPAPQTAAQAAASTAGEGGVLGYPKATAYLGQLFNNPAEQIAFSKLNPQQKAQKEAQFRAEGRL